MDSEVEKYVFEIVTPIGLSVRCSQTYWEFVSQVKHPAMKDRLDDVKSTLISPDEIRQSKKDPNVYLFYKGSKPRWVCVVCKDEKDFSFVVTAYPTSAIKSGEIVWKK